jgi:peptidoglycan/LPS O-acetylase OafA/YrhL
LRKSRSDTCGQPSVGTTKDHFVFLDYLRAMAAWAVVWDHMLGQWPADHGVHLRIVAAMRTYVAQPLGIIQDFGWMAVALFFLISGFVITHVAAREGVAEFLLKRFFRIFPLLAVFVLLATALNPGLRAHVGMDDLLRNMTLVNYVVVPQVITVGVAWTLVIELLFYLLTALTMWTRRQDIALGLNLLVPLVVIAISRRFGEDFFLFAASMAYVPYLAVGQLFYVGLYRRTIGPIGMTVGLAGCFAIILYGIRSIHTSFLPVTNSYLINFVYACLVFYVFYRLNQRLKSVAVVRFLAASSFAVYLVHGVIGRATFDLVWASWGVRPAILLALAVTVVSGALVHLVLERPLLAAAHRLVRQVRLDPARVSPVS